MTLDQKTALPYADLASHLGRATPGLAIGAVLLQTGDEMLLGRVECPIADPDALGQQTTLTPDALRGVLEEVLDRHPGVGPSSPATATDRRTLSAVARLVTVPDLTEDYVDKFASDLTEHGGVPATTAGADRRMRIVVIGAGLSGLAMAHELREHGFDYAIYEKHDEPGGVWVENTYPRCGLDTHPFAYAWSFGPSTEWESLYATRDHVLAYIQRHAAAFGATARTHYGHELTAARFDEESYTWRLLFSRTGTGEVVEVVCDILITAVGTLNQPAVPHVPGIEDFAGVTMHTARWDPSVELEGRRVAVVGNGSSGVQVTPALAEVASALTVFQRSPAWMKPRRTEVGEGPVPDWLRACLTQVATFGPVYRFHLYHRYGDAAHGLLRTADPRHRERSEAMRTELEAYIREQLDGDEDLVARTTPSYPPYAKRMVVDNDWYRTLLRDHVELVTSPVVGADRDGLVTADGRHHPLDVIVWGTGFRGTEFMVPVAVTGRSDRPLTDAAGGRQDLRAYLGVALPELPNFFAIQGPNSSIGHGGAATFVGETQSHYIAEVLRHLREHGLDRVRVRDEVVAAYNEAMDAEMSTMIWTVSDVRSRYKNTQGRIVANHPWTLQEYWNMTRRLRPEDYEMGRSPR
ncbi:flavin-containing monooxygenase [Actinosynnema sp.]|uniref:flavin-containing monooxygenase n=1 Tax=Actinosynnema sp. TaxID=1872144 RepID=UPI003F84DBE1